MAAKNIEDVRKMLMARLKSAMKATVADANDDMEDAMDRFYSGGTPKMYDRTGAMAKTPNVTNISYSGDSASFTAELKDGSSYTTGDKPSMAQVLNLANYGNAWITASGATARDTVGKKGFWEYAEKNIERDFYANIALFFK